MNELMNTKLTMTSTEIAELTGKEKKNIHADIKTQLLIGLYGFGVETMADKSTINKINGLHVELDERRYWREVTLDRYHTDILVSGYEVKYRAAIVKRWHELEKQLPSTYIQALEQLIETEKAKQLALENLEVKTIQLDESKEWYSVKRVAAKSHEHWKHFNYNDLKRLSFLKNKPPRKIFDANFGEVNVYHFDVWLELYPNEMMWFETD